MRQGANANNNQLVNQATFNQKTQMMQNSRNAGGNVIHNTQGVNTNNQQKLMSSKVPSLNTTQLSMVPNTHKESHNSNYQQPKKPVFFPNSSSTSSLQHQAFYTTASAISNNEAQKYQMPTNTNVSTDNIMRPQTAAQMRQSQPSKLQNHLVMEQSHIIQKHGTNSNMNQRTKNPQQATTTKQISLVNQHNTSMASSYHSRQGGAAIRQTPTHAQSQQEYAYQDHKSKKKNKQYELTVKILDADLFVNKSKFFQMSVHVKVKMEGQEDRKTASQSGQKPKWDETFVFPNIHRKDKIEFSVYHKGLFSGEELIGSALFIFDDVHPLSMKKFITLCDDGVDVGGLNLVLTVKHKTVQTPIAPAKDHQSAIMATSKQVGGLSRTGEAANKAITSQKFTRQAENQDCGPGIQASSDVNGMMGEEDNLIDDEVEHSIDYRDHEISRQVAVKQSSRNNRSNIYNNQGMVNISHTTDDILNSRYRKQDPLQSNAQQTQAQRSSQRIQGLSTTEAYINANGRPIATESSIIHHYTNQSSRHSQFQDGDYQEPPGDHDLSEVEQEQILSTQQNEPVGKKESLQYYGNAKKEQTRGTEPRNVPRSALLANLNPNQIGIRKSQQQNVKQPQSRNQGLAQSRSHAVRNDLYHQQLIVPQQLFYGPVASQAEQYSQTNSQANMPPLHQQLYMEISGKANYMKDQAKQPVQQLVNPNLETNGNEGCEEDENEMLMAVPQETDEGEQTVAMAGENEEPMMNMVFDDNRYQMNQFIIQQHDQPRYTQQLVNMNQLPRISVSQSQQQIHGHPRHLQEQLYTLQQPQPYFLQNQSAYMVLPGTSQNYPQFFQVPSNQTNINLGSLNFEEEGDAGQIMVTDPPTQSPLIVTPSSVPSQQQLFVGGGHAPKQFSLQQDYQALEQLRNDLREENQRIREQEHSLKKAYEQYQHDLAKLMFEKQEVKQLKENLKHENYKIQTKQEEYEYQRNQMERAYVNLKKEKGIVQQQLTILNETSKQFHESILSAKSLKGSSSVDSRKLDEIIQQTSVIQSSIQQMIALQQLSLSSALIGGGGLHLQQDSASSSCGTSSNNGGVQNQLNFNRSGKSGINDQFYSTSQHQISRSQIQEISPLGVPGAKIKGNSGQQRQSPPKVIADIFNANEEDMVFEPEGIVQKEDQQFGQLPSKKKRISPHPNPPRASNMEPVDEFDGNIRHLGQNRISDPMRNSQAYRNNQNQQEVEDQSTVTALKKGKPFFPPNLSENEYATSNPMANPLDSVIQKKQNNISVQSPQEQMNVSHIQHLIEVNNNYNHQPLTKERIQLDQERRQYEESKQHLEGLYQQLRKELDEIQSLKQQYTMINSAAQTSQLNTSMMSHVNNLAQNTVSPFNPGGAPTSNYEDSRVIEAAKVQIPKKNETLQSAAQHRGNELSTRFEETIASPKQPHKVEDTSLQVNSVRKIQQSNEVNMPPNENNCQPKNQAIPEEENKEDDFDFIPDPDFLKKINMNMLQNDKHFNNQGQPLVPTRSAAVAMASLANNGALADAAVNFETQPDQQIDLELQPFIPAAMIQVDPNAIVQEYGYEQEDENFQLSNSDYQLMFGQHTANVGVPPLNINNTSTQGQGDRKIEYIQDQFEEEDYENGNGQQLNPMLAEGYGNLPMINDHSPINHQQIDLQIQGDHPHYAQFGELEEVNNEEGLEAYYEDQLLNDNQNLIMIEPDQNQDDNYMEQNDEESKYDDNYGTIKRDHHSSQVPEMQDHTDKRSFTAANQSSQRAENATKEHQIPFDLIIKAKNEKLNEEEIQKLIDEYMYDDQKSSGRNTTNQGANTRDQSIIYNDGKVFDEKKRAIYGIQKSKAPF